MYPAAIPDAARAAEVMRAALRAELRDIHTVSRDNLRPEGRVMDRNLSNGISRTDMGSPDKGINREDMDSPDRDISREDMDSMDMMRSGMVRRIFLIRKKCAGTKLWACCLTWGFWC